MDMDDFMGFLKVCGIVLAALAGFVVVFILIASIMFSMSTHTGTYVVIPQVGESFKVKKYTTLDNHAILYTKMNGDTGKISGSFRIETITETEKDSK